MRARIKVKYLEYGLEIYLSRSEDVIIFIESGKLPLIAAEKMYSTFNKQVKTSYLKNRISFMTMKRLTKEHDNFLNYLKIRSEPELYEDFQRNFKC